MRKINVATLLAVTLLIACSDITKPVYWSCSGNHIQVVENQFGKVLEKYEGRQKLLLEVYQGSVSQFNAPATFGIYELCLDNKEMIVFSFQKCHGNKRDAEGRGDPGMGSGLLDKANGSLVFNGARNLNNLKIVSSGIYACKYLGHRYSYDDLTPADDQ